jgi:hypothetical protein
MRLLWVAGIAIPLWMFSSKAFAEPYYFLRKGHISCAYESRSKLEAIADAKSDDALKSAVASAIYSGACATASESQIAVVNVKEFKTGGGNLYYCFYQGDKLDGEAARFCALERHITSIEEEKKKRSGEYNVTGEGAGGLRAECVEGGYVLIFKTGDSLKRMSLVFPKALYPASQPISNDRDREIRLGCRGIDYDE